MAIVAVLEHADDDDASAALAHLKSQPLDAFLQARLEKALERHRQATVRADAS